MTFKFRYSCEDDLFDVVKEYNSVLRFTYNRLVDNPKYRTAEITQMQKFLNNCDLIGSYLRCSAIFDAKSLISKSDKKVIFGGKKLFVDRCKNKISKEDFCKKKLRPITCIGEACRGGNRLFKIIDESTVEFRLNRNSHFTLHLSGINTKRKKRT